MKPLFLFACLALIFAPLSADGSSSPQSFGKPSAVKKRSKKNKKTKQPQVAASMKFTEPKKPMNFEEGKSYFAKIHTTKGVVTCELFPERAPLSVTNFIQLSKGGFYDGLTFHRVVPGFVVQGGDPDGTGSGGPGYTVSAEIGLPHTQGALAWARLPDEVNPQQRSSGSQFYITLEEVPFLDGNYTVFGQTIDGMDAVQKMAVGDKIEKVEIEIQ